jgi:alanine-glyoxylate transaminase / serine-glyoxylate transaminase / serine-pyruvate transaminase
VRKPKLMIPGPIEVAPDVLLAMGEPLIAHYGTEWTNYYKQTLELAKRIFHTNGDVFLVPGSGSAGLDMALASTLSSDTHVLIPSNGFFGERLQEIALTHSSHVHVLESALGQPIDVTRIEETIDNLPVAVVAMVQCETSTGVINPVRRIAKLCHQKGVLMIVDAIASLGIEPLEMDAWNIDLCVSASQKGLESPPGLALVAVGEDGWRRIHENKPTGWYLNLAVWKDYATKWDDWHPHPITQAVNNIRALHRSMTRILDEGLSNRFERHRNMAGYLRNGLKCLGLQLFVQDNIASHGVTAVVGPHGRVQELLIRVREEHGILLAGSLGTLKGKIFRIGTMGPGACEETIDILLSALSEVISSMK